MTGGRSLLLYLLIYLAIAITGIVNGNATASNETVTLASNASNTSTTTTTTSSVATTTSPRIVNGNATASNETVTVASNASNTSTTTTTSSVATTTSPNFALARIRLQFRITSEVYSQELTMPLTERYRLLAERVTAMVSTSMAAKFGRDKILTVEVERFWSGSVNTALNVLVETNRTSASEINPDHISQLTVLALRELAEGTDSQLNIDTGSILLIDIDPMEPTQPPQTTETSYSFNRIQFTMKAPNEVYRATMDNSASEEFRVMENNLQEGVRTMLIKSYPEEAGWQVVTDLVRVWNDSEKGLWMKFTVTISPQLANTTEKVSELGRNYVYFSRMGTYQIDPSSVNVEDLTKYAPDMGVVVINDEYRKQMLRTKYNGSYVGDFVTGKPRRKAAKVHEQYLLQIAVPAFVGMVLFLAVILICTTTDSGKEKFYHQL